jgi:transcriptional regulator GlxA family with amidase domain
MMVLAADGMLVNLADAPANRATFGSTGTAESPQAPAIGSGKPVAAICHGPWTLITAGVVQGRRLTSWPSLRDDLRNAGAEPVDEQVVVDGQFTTSRSPADLPAFCPAIVEQFAASRAPS